MTLSRTLPLAAILMLAVAIIYLLGAMSRPALASVAVSSEYQATTTAASTLYGNGITTDAVIKTGYGTLGSVVITGANTGIVNVYDATTTDVNKRTGNVATSTILIASLPASLVAGTYTFDVAFRTGLLIDLVSGSMPTSTITYR